MAFRAIRRYAGAQAKYQAAPESFFQGTMRSVPRNGPKDVRGRLLLANALFCLSSERCFSHFSALRSLGFCVLQYTACCRVSPQLPSTQYPRQGYYTYLRRAVCTYCQRRLYMRDGFPVPRNGPKDVRGRLLLANALFCLSSERCFSHFSALRSLGFCVLQYTACCRVSPQLPSTQYPRQGYYTYLRRAVCTYCQRRLYMRDGFPLTQKR